MQSAESKIIKGLAFYMLVFAFIIALVGTVLTYFHSNINSINSGVEANSEITKLNLYFLNITKAEDVLIKNYGLVNNEDLSSYYITFENKDGRANTFIKIENMIYFNKIKVCEDVEEFIIDVDNSTKEHISVSVKILGKKYEMQYVIN